MTTTASKPSPQMKRGIYQWAILVVAVLALVAVLTSSTGAQASATSPTAAFAVFNNPSVTTQMYSGGSREQRAINNLDYEAVYHAPQGSLIQVSIFQASGRDPLPAWLLYVAQWRGVNVEVVADGGLASYGCGKRPGCVNTAFSELEQLNVIHQQRPLTWFVACDGIGPGNAVALPNAGHGCLGQSLDHNKLMMLSNTALFGATRSDVVMQTSSNNTTGMYLDAFNNALVIADQPAVYADYQRYFFQLASAYRSTKPTSQQLFTGSNGHRVDTATLGGHDITTWSFPRAASDDPVNQQLSEIPTSQGCANHTGGSRGAGPRHTRVDIAMASVSGRSAAIHRIAGLEQSGCHVRFLYDTISAGDRRILSSAHVALYQLNLPATATRQHLYVHSKYVLVEGSEHGLGANRRILYTGSPNLSDGSLTRSDERMIRYVESATADPIYRAYHHNFDTMLGFAIPG